MNKVLIKLLLSVSTLTIASGCATIAPSADLPIYKKEVSSFASISSDVSKLNKSYGATNVLIVLDIDNTLLTSSVDLGGDIWYQWQRGKLSV